MAMRTYIRTYLTILDVGCFSHTTDHVGKKFALPVIDNFTGYKSPHSSTIPFLEGCSSIAIDNFVKEYLGGGGGGE